MWKLHELSNTIMSNRDFQFVSLICKIVCKTLKINVKLSTAFHLETNDQSEIANQKIKSYLRNYCNYQQNNWSKWLFMIEFVSNAATFAFTELFVFMTNYDFESKMSFDSSNSNDDFFRERFSAKEWILTQKTVIITKKMRNIWNFIKKKLVDTQNIQKRYVDRKRTFSSNYKFEDVIWLFIKNIKIEWSFRKLNHKWINLFNIKKMQKDVCQLDLSQLMKIHNIFHISLLRKTATNSLTDQIQSLSSSIVINEDEKEKYEINVILDN